MTTATTNYSPAEMRERLQDRDWLLACIKGTRDTTEWHCRQLGLNEDVAAAAAVASCMMAEQNIETVFACSESPIETMLLSSLAMMDLRQGITDLVFVGKMPDFDQNVCEYRGNYKGASDFVDHCTAMVGKDADREALMDAMRAEMQRIGVYSDAEFGNLMRYVVPILCRSRSSVFMSMQPVFKDLLNGRGIRADAATWRIDDTGHRFVIECDGFDYHSKRREFDRDRKRDRALSAKGFRVLRYSGSEIFHDPVGSAANLYEALMSI